MAAIVATRLLPPALNRARGDAGYATGGGQPGTRRLSPRDRREDQRSLIASVPSSSSWKALSIAF
jgi:hypothetical protein